MARGRQVPLLDLDPVWRALANPVRRRMLDVLRDGPQTTGDVAAYFPDLSRFAVMQHLGVLEEGGLIIPHRDGRQRFNYLNPVPIQQIADRWVNRYQGAWSDALIALKATLEREGLSARTRSKRRKSA
jgi:DNA-binding transcriptional ArsR family regulator